MSSDNPASFTDLCEAHAYVCTAETHVHAGVRGLRTTGAVPAGDPVIAVPWELVLTSPVAATSKHRVAAHHIDVVGQLLAALNSSHGNVRAQFWRQWSAMLPRLADLPHPAALPRELLGELQDSHMAATAQLARAHVEESIGCTACDVAHWATALVRSRPFTLPPPSNDDASAGGIFAFVPFADMANHEGHAPSCEVRAVGSKATPDQYTAVELVALRPLQPHEMMTIDYGLSRAFPSTTFSDFGFVMDSPEALARDELARLHARAANDFTTGLEADEALLEASARAPGGDARMHAIVSYRVHMKRALRSSISRGTYDVLDATLPHGRDGVQAPLRLPSTGAVAWSTAGTGTVTAVLAGAWWCRHRRRV